MAESDPRRREAAVERTAQWMSRGRRVLAYGGFDGVVARPLRYGEEGVFPQFVESAEGGLPGFLGHRG